MKPIIRIALFFAATALAVPNDKNDKVSQDLNNAGPNAMVTVIVQFDSQPDKNGDDDIDKKGAKLTKKFKNFKGGVYYMPASALGALANTPGVKYISPNRPLRSRLDVTSAAMGADIAKQYGWTGKGVGVAVLDSGVDTGSPDLRDPLTGASRVVYSESFVGVGAADLYGHGSHVAGIIGGNGANSGGQYHGIAPDVKIISLRALDQNGAGTESAVIAAIDRVIELKSQFNIRVMNISLGRPIYESYKLDPLCQAVEMAWKAGIVVIVAAGNNGRDNMAGTHGYGTIMSPGNDPYVITVGAMKTQTTAIRSDDQIASFSSKGPALVDRVVKPDLVAPGNRIVSLRASGSTLDLAYPSSRVATPRSGNAAYFRMSGTSMAAPVVSGAAALLLAKEPTLTPDQVKARLMKTAAKAFPSYSVSIDPVTRVTYFSLYDIFTVGAGYLDIAAALNNGERSNGRALSPLAVYDAVTRKVRLVLNAPAGESLAWGDSLAWGESFIWGNSVLLGGSAVAWGDSLAWGDSTTAGFNAIWGNSVAWGDSDPLAESLIGGEGEN
jgi:serine protease AprX